MQYDPIKRVLGEFFNKNVFSRIFFYRCLHLLLLRPWYVNKRLNSWSKKRPNKAHILDAAGGFGHYAYYLSRKNEHWNILSVDINREQICDCNQFFQKLKRHNIVFKTADLTTFREVGVFDLILCLDVLEFIEQDELVLNNFYDSLCHGGMLLLTTPSLMKRKSKITEQVRPGYDLVEMEGKLKKIGFKHVKSSYAIGMFGKTSNAITLVVPVFLMSLSRLFLVLLPFYFIALLPLILLLNFLDTFVKVIYGDGLIVNAWK
jgi:2-polyprenyl-3-methyl-5-hydroxy-6-metoxy-1,4-benzoquinol methylase